MKKLISVLLILSLMCPLCGSLAEETEKTAVIPPERLPFLPGDP